jgi:hypothetical protein
MSRSFVDVRGREEVLLMGAIFLSTGMEIGRREKLMERGEIHIKAGCVAVRWGAGFRVWLDMVPWNNVGLYKSTRNRDCDQIKHPNMERLIRIRNPPLLSCAFRSWHPQLGFTATHTLVGIGPASRHG